MTPARQSEESISDELQSADLCKRRLRHLMEYGADSPGVVSQWKRKRLDRLLVDHFVRCGFYELAVNLARQSQIDQLTNIDIFLVAKEVRQPDSDGAEIGLIVRCAACRTGMRRILIS